MHDLKPLILQVLALSNKPLTKNQISERLSTVLKYNPYSAVHRLLNEKNDLIRNGLVKHYPKREKYCLELLKIDAKTQKMVTKPLKKKKTEKIRFYEEYSITLKGLIDYIFWLVETDYSVSALEKIGIAFEKQDRFSTPLFKHWKNIQKTYSKEQLLFVLKYAFTTLKFSRDYHLLNARTHQKTIEDQALRKLAFHLCEALAQHTQTPTPEITKIAEYGILNEYNNLTMKLEQLEKTAKNFNVELE